MDRIIDALTTWTLYRCYDARGVLLYIGCAESPLARLKAHNNKATWANRCSYVELGRSYSDKEKAFKAEAKAIRTERPIYNRQHNSGRKAGKAKNPVMVEAGRRAAETRKRNAEISKRSVAAYKAWDTRRRNGN